MRQLEIGSIVDVGTVTNPTEQVSAATVDAINTATGVVTLSKDPSGTVDSSDFIFRSGAKNTTDGSTNELTGLQAIVNNSGTLYNINPTSVTLWKSTVNGNGGTNRAATDNLFETVIDDIGLESGTSPNFIVTTVGVRRNYASQLKSSKAIY